jgi:hypothetical protein
MEELIQGLITKCGLDEDTAKKVAEFIKENATDIPKWLGKAGVDLPGGIDKLF